MTFYVFFSYCTRFLEHWLPRCTLTSFILHRYVDGRERVRNSYIGRLLALLLNLDWTVIATVFSTGIWKSSEGKSCL